MIKLLPKWCLTGARPAIYDIDSGTAIEQTALLYAKMNELIEDYNKFVDDVNLDIETFINEHTTSYEEFRLGMEQKFNDFVKVVELKLSSQDSEIASAIEYMMTNLQTTVREVLNELINNGDISINLEYNSNSENLEIVMNGGSN